MVFAIDGKTKRTKLVKEVKELQPSRCRKLIPFLIIAVMLWLPGCSGESAQEPSQKPLSTTQQKPTPPAQMKSMLAEEESLLENLQQQAQKEKLAAQQATAEAQLKAQEAALAKQKAEQEAQQKAQQEAESPKTQQTTPSAPAPTTPQAEQNQQSQTTPSETEPVLAQSSQAIAFWQQASLSVTRLNQYWDALETQVVKAGLTTTQRDKIKKALDNLTAAVKAQDTEKSMLTAIELFGQSGNLAKVYTFPVPYEYFQLNYEIMMSAMEADKMQWAAATARISKMQSNWNTVKAAAKGKNTSLITQTESSISDYENALRGRQSDIVASKAEIALQNLKTVEEALTAMAASTTSQTSQ